jgi:dienelactone hydrolase
MAIDWSKGVGVAGHSMGGQATVRTAARAKEFPLWNISAAVLHHPYWTTGPEPSQITVPIAGFTGEADFTCPPNETTAILNATTGVPTT